ncbi:LysR substrate-binding domain-containing protein [Acuticoccus sp.]|uniref:LysR substrate-binding domain-containing protein n=1 Tax=Acuticoccus sp. TaxID=1904378 RepID=UPI003B52A120
MRLFYRTSRKLKLTEAGQLFYDNAREIENRFGELARILAEHQSEPRGLLHVHTRHALATHFLAPVIPAFHARYPNVTLKLWLTEDTQDLVERDVDVALRLGNLEEPALAVRKLMDASARVVFASPDYLARTPPIREPEDLFAHNCLTFLDGRFEDGHAVWRFQRDDDVRELRVRGALQVNNPAVLVDAALAGMGIALLPIWCLGGALSDERLVHVLPEYRTSPTTFDHSIYVVYEKSRHVPPKVRAFVDFLVEAYRGRAS